MWRRVRGGMMVLALTYAVLGALNLAHAADVADAVVAVDGSSDNAFNASFEPAVVAAGRPPMEAKIYNSMRQAWEERGICRLLKRPDGTPYTTLREVFDGLSGEALMARMNDITGATDALLHRQGEALKLAERAEWTKAMEVLSAIDNELQTDKMKSEITFLDDFRYSAPYLPFVDITPNYEGLKTPEEYKPGILPVTLRNTREYTITNLCLRYMLVKADGTPMKLAEAKSKMKDTTYVTWIQPNFGGYNRALSTDDMPMRIPPNSAGTLNLLVDWHLTRELAENPDVKLQLTCIGVSVR